MPKAVDHILDKEQQEERKQKKQETRESKSKERRPRTVWKIRTNEGGGGVRCNVVSLKLYLSVIQKVCRVCC